MITTNTKEGKINITTTPKRTFVFLITIIDFVSKRNTTITLTNWDLLTLTPIGRYHCPQPSESESLQLVDYTENQT